MEIYVYGFLVDKCTRKILISVLHSVESCLIQLLIYTNFGLFSLQVRTLETISMIESSVLKV